MNFLFKEEPANYSDHAPAARWHDHVDGRAHLLAQKHLRSVAKGDRIFFYHTGSEKSVVGIMKAAGPAYPDPADKTGSLCRRRGAREEAGATGDACVHQGRQGIRDVRARAGSRGCR